MTEIDIILANPHCSRMDIATSSLRLYLDRYCNGDLGSLVARLVHILTKEFSPPLNRIADEIKKLMRGGQQE